MDRQNSAGVVKFSDEKRARSQVSSVSEAVEKEAFRSGLRSRSRISLAEAQDMLMQDAKFAFLVNAADAPDLPAEIIRELRLSLGWSQARLAKELGISQARVSTMEAGTGKEGLTIGTLARIAEACGHTLQIVVQASVRKLR